MAEPMNVEMLLKELAAMRAEFAEMRRDIAEIRVAQSKIDADLGANRQEIHTLSERLVYREKWLLGWDEIAGHLGMCAANAMLLGRPEAEDPLPHEKIGHNVRARATALDAWNERRRVSVRRNKSASASRANTERWKKYREKNARPS